MSEFTVEISWEHAPRAGHPDDYGRAHQWRLAGGQTVRASAAPEYAGDPEHTNPEEGLIAAVSSCHMLTFLAVAAKRGFKVARYTDQASGTLGKNADGRLAVTEIVLRPQIGFEGQAPSADELDRLHASAHRNCFIGNSLTATVRVE
ncbi:MAG TPA: osmotically inducible protein OsmC [Gammaproteobacteria bacterium]|nr:osmotically inducible protein OsmC [Gammaproteobacteria bacterium]